MQTSRALRFKAATLLAADTATLAAAAGSPPVVALIKGPFAVSELTVVGDLELADFDGSTPIEIDEGTQPSGLSADSADGIITIAPPAGGFLFETTGVTNLPQTIYGIALLKNDLSELYACMALSTPVVLTAVNQNVPIPTLTIRQIAGTMV